MKKPLYFVLWAFVLVMSFLSLSSWSMDDYDMTEESHLILNSQQTSTSNNSCRELCPFYLGTCAACFEFDFCGKREMKIGSTTGELVQNCRYSSIGSQFCCGLTCAVESITMFFSPNCVTNICIGCGLSVQQRCVFQSLITVWATPCLCQTALCLPGAACYLMNNCCTLCPNEFYMRGLEKGRACKAPGCFSNELCLEKTIRCLDITLCCAWLPCISSEYSFVKRYMKNSILFFNAVSSTCNQKGPHIAV